MQASLKNVYYKRRGSKFTLKYIGKMFKILLKNDIICEITLQASSYIADYELLKKWTPPPTNTVALRGVLSLTK